MQYIFIILFSSFFAINLFSFFLMLDDKKKSRRGERRISEGKLFFSAICFGALGVFFGMFVARHKTQKMIFILGVPLALVQNLSLIYLFYNFFIIKL